MGEPVRIYDFAQKLIKRFGDGRSSVQITGLREGEKLYEELLTAEDNSIPTEYKKIFKAIVESNIYNKTVNLTDEVGRLLNGLIKSLKA